MTGKDSGKDSGVEFEFVRDEDHYNLAVAGGAASLSDVYAALEQYGIEDPPRSGLARYLVQRIEPGSTVRAILECDLAKAVTADPALWAAVPLIHRFLYNRVPSGVWSSPEHVRWWLDGGKLAEKPARPGKVPESRPLDVLEEAVKSLEGTIDRHIKAAEARRGSYSAQVHEAIELVSAIIGRGSSDAGFVRLGTVLSHLEDELENEVLSDPSDGGSGS